MSEVPKSPRKSLEDLKRHLENSKPVYVDKTGRLTTPEEEAVREKIEGNAAGNKGRTTIKPSRWF